MPSLPIENLDYHFGARERSCDGDWSASVSLAEVVMVLLRKQARRLRSSQAAHSKLHLDLLRVRLVRLDDHLHEFVPYHIFLAEVDELDAFDVREHAFGFHQAAAFARR